MIKLVVDRDTEPPRPPQPAVMMVFGDVMIGFAEGPTLIGGNVKGYWKQPHFQSRSGR